MSEGKARAFYKSSVWIKCSRAYMKSQHYVCERCGGVAEICHHKVFLTPQNIDDPEVTLNWNLLEAVCRTCHAQIHFGKGNCADGLMFDENGNLIHAPG